MLLETFDWGLEARSLQLIFGLVIGVLFGIAAQVSRFCLRRAIAGERSERGTAGAVWVMALATAIVGFLGAQTFGFVDLTGHRYLDRDIAWAAIVIGGVAFGAGMVLTRGCVSRLTILSANGNMRAVTVLIIFAIVAHATLKGVLAPVRTLIGSLTFASPIGSLAELPFGAPAAAAFAVVAAAYSMHKFRPTLRDTLAGIVIGLVAVAGWSTTSVLLFDEFDPQAVQSLAFTLPWTDTLFWTIASTAIPAGFGVGLISGVLLGSFASALVRRELKLEGFDAPHQFLRYATGGMLMGVGGVLAGGCTIGAGLGGSASLGVSALLALVSIIAGGVLAGQFGATARRPQIA